MLGFSLGKLLVLLGIVLAVWYGYRWLSRVRQIREQRKNRVLSAQDTVRCPRCEAFVVADGPSSCGRADCPYAA